MTKNVNNFYTWFFCKRTQKNYLPLTEIQKLGIGNNETTKGISRLVSNIFWAPFNFASQAINWLFIEPYGDTDKKSKSSKEEKDPSPVPVSKIDSSTATVEPSDATNQTQHDDNQPADNTQDITKLAPNSSTDTLSSSLSSTDSSTDKNEINKDTATPEKPKKSIFATLKGSRFGYFIDWSISGYFSVMGAVAFVGSSIYLLNVAGLDVLKFFEVLGMAAGLMPVGILPIIGFLPIIFVATDIIKYAFTAATKGAAGEAFKAEKDATKKAFNKWAYPDYKDEKEYYEKEIKNEKFFSLKRLGFNLKNLAGDVASFIPAAVRTAAALLTLRTITAIILIVAKACIPGLRTHSFGGSENIIPSDKVLTAIAAFAAATVVAKEIPEKIATAGANFGKLVYDSLAYSFNSFGDLVYGKVFGSDDNPPPNTVFTSDDNDDTIGQELKDNLLKSSHTITPRRDSKASNDDNVNSLSRAKVIAPVTPANKTKDNDIGGATPFANRMQ